MGWGRAVKNIYLPADNKLHELCIEDFIDNYQRDFLIFNWTFGRHRIISRITDPLGDYRITFKGYEGYSLGLRRVSWDRNMWEIFPQAPAPPIPEASTYGAIFVALGVGVMAFRRRRAKAVASLGQVC